MLLFNQHEVKNINFKRFMADSVHVNFNALKKIFGLRNKNIPIEEKERTCQFHWSMTLDHHSKQLINLELQRRHIKLCNDYWRCRSKVDADLAMTAIKAWWFLSKAYSKSAIKDLTSFLDFWYFPYEQWGPTSLRHYSHSWYFALL